MKTPANPPSSFVFTTSNLAKAKKIIAKYPEGRQASALVPLLELAQRQSGNWLPRAAMDAVAVLLGLPPVRVYEAATFYTMFNLTPVGQHHIQVCRTTPCWLKGSDKIVETCRKKLGINPGETTADGKFTLTEVECLGACTCAPAAQINDTTYENLTPEKLEKTLDTLAAKPAGKKAR
ncbi:MAG: NADH-quinone oxidoreductase subunit NuoE [Alphaproteobacteria bacterium]|nr:NADH-quinone oxidoreductase subunit NuoE [Alphaproteobacteria bacterium]